MWVHRSFTRGKLRQHKSYRTDDLEKIQNAVDRAHQADIPVIYVTVRFRESYPEISPRNRCALGTEHLVLCGVATSGVVLSTLREAADKDYQITVLEDGCLDADSEVHRILLTKVFPRQAEVMQIEMWKNSLH